MHDAIEPGAFRHTLGHHPTGVVVITSAASGTPSGLVVGTFTSVSLDPPLVGFLPAKSSTSWPPIAEAGTFAANILADDQLELCKTFATSGGDKYATTSWRPGPGGSPLIDGALAWIECSIERIDDAGDHWFVLGRVRDLSVERTDARPLMFFGGGYGTFTSMKTTDGVVTT